MPGRPATTGFSSENGAATTSIPQRFSICCSAVVATTAPVGRTRTTIVCSNRRRMNWSRRAATKFCAPRRLQFIRRLFEQTIVVRVRPTGAVVATTAEQQIEKRCGIEVVAAPFSEENPVVAGLPGIEHDAHFLAHERDVDAEIFAPHLLHHFRHGLAGVALLIESHV